MGKKYILMILTCDKNIDLWEVLLNQIEKYWPDYSGEIFFNTEKSVLEQGGYKNTLRFPKQKYEWDTPWSLRLLSCLNEIKEEYVLFLLDDFILTKAVDFAEIEQCVKLMEENSDIACFNYMPTNSEYIKREYERYELKDRKAPFRINLQAALWRKSFLVKYIRKHENPWQFESWGSMRARRYSDKIYHIEKDAPIVFDYPEGGVLADNRWRGKEAIELMKNEGYKIDFEVRGFYEKGDKRKTEIVHRTFIQKVWQVFKSLV